MTTSKEIWAKLPATASNIYGSASFQRLELALLERVMKQFNMTTGEKMLSLACDQGRIEEALLKDVKTIDYVDISPRYMATVRKKIEKGKLPPGR